MKIATLGFPIREDEFLIGRKSKNAEIGKGKFNAPGGKQEEGESLEDCLRRELREEMDIDPTVFEKVAVVTGFFDGVPTFEVHTYLVHSFSGTPKDTEHMTEVGWRKMLKSTYRKMHDGDEYWLPRLLEQQEKFNANLFYKGNGEGFERAEFLPFSE